MIDIIHFGGGLPAPTQLPGSGGLPGGSRFAEQEEDLVELSRAGMALSCADHDSSFRTAKVAAIRAEIAAGTYETSERLMGTVDRMLDVLG